MPQTKIACPRCRQSIPAQVEQLFDVTSDPAAKQRLIGRVSNYARCSFCGFEGPLSTPIVYHDNEKELLLTYFPAELGLPVNEQEKLVGPLITQVMNKLPAEKRKGYLLRPQSFLTFQSMIEKILEKDGVSKEMLDEQQKRLALLQRLLQITTPDVRAEVIQQNQDMLDDTFFALFNRLVDAANASGQQQTAQAMAALQNELLEGSEYGRKLKEQFGELEAAVKTLQEAGEGLTRERLLEIFIAAPSERRLQALVSMTRNGLDYNFFQILTARIDQASGEEKTNLENLRDKVLDMTNQIDKAMQEQMKQADAFIEQILAAPNIQEATAQNLDQFNNEVIAQVVNAKLREASQKKDAARLDKLQQMVMVLQQASVSPEQVKQAEAFIEQILAAPDIQQATAENIEQFGSEMVVQVLEAKLREANEKKDAARMDKLQQMVMVLQQANTPPEMEIIGELLDAAGDDASLEQALKAHEADLTEELTGMMASLMQQVESQGEKNPQGAEILRRLEKVYRLVVKRAMQKNLGK
jgi:hypothetical protein